ncbi:GNAT family N-acetyltransferase [Opitutus terrae]|uniref:Aminoglycoside N(6')-acetyltransferase type 1 n=1 Tax=Opitutus terrae (strain DSM 11246 / JCM 15787 / PB90-1) TaxID=452637 RepID=B1ZSS5_OPITP|nr:GNAT family N-acetyltransferase [Opitutus terrae]ACB74769.1 GCN5-related N-acetyltransferase [Opitutus terrae PB90-1]
MRIRPLAPADLAEWARMRQTLWPDCPPRRTRVEMRELLRDPRMFGVLVLDRGTGMLGGFVELALRAGVDGAAGEWVGFLEGWYVDPDLRQRGWGRKLVCAAERWAAERGMTELASDTELGNRAAIDAHRGLGFRETFRTVQFLKRIRRR